MKLKVIVNGPMPSDFTVVDTDSGEHVPCVSAKVEFDCRSQPVLTLTTMIFDMEVNYDHPYIQVKPPKGPLST